MNRREFVALAAGAAVWPAAGVAQRTSPVVGFLSSGSASAAASRSSAAAFRRGLAEAGFVEGRNVAIEYAWADDRYDLLPELAANLVRRGVAVIVTNNPATPAAKRATTTIPVVFAVGVDPVGAGLVASLNRPGGNLTGTTSLNVELGPKLLELLRELVPAAKDFALLVNPANPNAATLSRDLTAAANALGLRLEILRAGSDNELDAAFASMATSRSAGLVIGADAFFNARSERLAALAARDGVPAISQYRAFASAGGLVSYGGVIDDQFRQSGVYVARILKGEKPADLPVQQTMKLEMVVNLKAAKALGLDVSLPLLGRADEVIE